MGLKIAFHQKHDLNQKNILEGIETIKPLYQTDPGRINDIREWSKTKAKPASSNSEIAKGIGDTRKVTISGSEN